jgi:hypothetical protein
LDGSHSPMEFVQALFDGCRPAVAVCQSPTGHDFDVLLLEGSYVSDPNVRRAAIADGNDRCSVEEYASRYFRRQGYSALRVENEPIAALLGVFM